MIAIASKARIETLDIEAWLQGLGMERYTPAFLENDIVPTVLRELTDQDLKDLGVSLGHRRLLLKAISALPDERASASPLEMGASASRRRRRHDPRRSDGS